jgi:NAD(P)-dependent dehydrogenase (short-subunit alcohol dehydrogenase family)
LTLFDVTDRVAVVTGAAVGIGRAYADGLSSAGALVILTDIDPRGEQVAAEIRAAGRAAVFVRADVASRTDVTEMASFVADEYGRADIIVNNAAVEGVPTATSLAELDEAVYDRVLAVNAKGMWLMAQAFAPLLRQAVGVGGSIINQGSIGAFLGAPGFLSYCASKHAVLGITQTLARELGAANIRVNCLAPGVVITDAMSKVPRDVLDGMLIAQAIPTFQHPHDLLGPLLFLASDASRFVTGQTLVVDGGNVLLP